MTPERLDQIRTIYRLSRLAAPDAAVTKALEELIGMAEIFLHQTEGFQRGQMAQHQKAVQQGQMDQFVVQQPQWHGQYGSSALGFGMGFPQSAGGLQQDLNQMQRQAMGMAQDPRYVMKTPPVVPAPKQPWWKLW